MTFSLLMPSYNQARFIGEAVASVLAQDDPDWELDPGQFHRRDPPGDGSLPG
jgi:hypothetical protein